MNPLGQPRIRRLAFVCRNLAGENLRHARALLKLQSVEVIVICEQHDADHAGQVFARLVCVSDAHDAEELADNARQLADEPGGLDRIVTTTETLLEPVARASEKLALPGPSPDAVRKVLDKPCLKAALRQAGIGVARDIAVTSKEDAGRFAAQVGFPIILKPAHGSGGLATYRVRSPAELAIVLGLMQPSRARPVLAEEYLHGRELCIDTIAIASEPQMHSICLYRPSILEALEDRLIQWSCLMIRDIDLDGGQKEFVRQGLAAARALSVGDAMTHMEGFILEDGRICFTDATLRPAGARIAPMLGFACDVDPYLVWARVAAEGCFEGPWAQKYAVGTIFLRGPGRGLVQDVNGIDAVTDAFGNLLVDGRLPRVGAARALTYTGDGYITVRHPETKVVEDALDFIARTVSITYAGSAAQSAASESHMERWKERLGYEQLNKPVWDNDLATAVGNPADKASNSEPISEAIGVEPIGK